MAPAPELPVDIVKRVGPGDTFGRCRRCHEALCALCLGCKCRHQDGCPYAPAPAPVDIVSVFAETLRICRTCPYCRHDRPLDGTPCDTCGAPTA